MQICIANRDIQAASLSTDDLYSAWLRSLEMDCMSQSIAAVL
ncbi:hypothetical protein DSC_11920 [Pseudoxanthomonas spadix BD-a59]|uniref:Uncharacterized protein n=1 Tax=Pseudoxanthomonas spadix (strain BD-a59) TaxID=1045855 RepID=G7UQV6_PSEUP|nr:hypothetical protein DSC_11920 [Pseudoxanthomonas spadix BD-a59]